ncbi:hypothetical protein Sjap_004183 [Stephania japonica]|uniref:Integrase catalytic domain-containing protein n=1 Tax=Stephania japonica TaxID=461633 RepID=A0AAP0PK31_9MAGN
MKYMGSQQNMPSPNQPQMRFTPSIPQQQSSFIGTTSHCPDSSWYMDSGASSHITSDPSQLGNCTPYGGNDSLMVGNGTYLPITNTGSAFIPSTGSKLSFHNTLCVPSIRKNLLSVSQLTRDNNVLIEFRRNTCLVKDIPTNEVLLHGSLHNGLYRLVGPPVHSPGTSSAFLATNKGLSSLWHSRLGHPAHRVLCQVFNNHLRLPLKSVHNFCSYCPLGKIHALPFTLSHHISSHVLDLIHTDVWGPSPVTSINGFNYYIHFMDDCTRFTWLYPLRLKSDAVKAFIHFKTMVENQFQTTIKRVQSDWGGEFRSFKPILDYHGIIFQHSCPHTHEQNGRAERKHRHIVEMSLVLLAQSQLPMKFWWDACETACFLINRLPTVVLKGLSPYEKLYQKVPDYGILRVFGCACFPYLRPYNKHKYQFRSEKCVFLGYSSIHKGYKCLNSAGRIFITRHVLFNEDEFSYNMLFQQHFFPGGLPDHGVFSVPLPNYNPPTDPESTLSMSPSQSSLPSSSSSPSLPVSPISLNEVPTSESGSNSTSNACIPMNTHSMITRAKDGISKKKVFIAHTSDITNDIPTKAEIALKDPKWKEAMDKEYHALMQNTTWSLVPASSSQNVVDNKWIFSIKRNSDGSINRYKARLVAKGFRQVPGIDFGETYSPVVKAATIRVILSLAVQLGWSLRQLDINNAFLNGTLSEEVFTNQPLGFVDSQFPSHVCKLHKALYGLRQAPRAWFDKLKSTLVSWGFRNSKADNSLFVFRSESTVLYILVYVDDIIVTGSQISSIQSFINKLHTSFALKDIGELNYFLGMETRRDKSGLYLTQTAYINQLLKQGGMLNAKPIDTPCSLSKPLYADGSPSFNDATLYRSLLGGLQYLVHTRPDISFIVNRLSQFQQTPTVTHWQALKRVLRYLKGTTDMGICFRPSSHLYVTGFSDADWATSPDDRRSVAGYAVYLGCNLVAWQSKKQPVVSRSSTESEYRALAQVTAEIAWLQSLLSELGFSFSIVLLVWCDNLSATRTAKNPALSFKNKAYRVGYSLCEGQSSFRATCGSACSYK